ncbi:tRNA epoxyqueuosine(34) reductase QueG [Bacillota bacterium LX-D]|nr:tRNA epoxyqueuosine(34) reductase QueG [Bacillota bacterium LX-D]
MHKGNLIKEYAAQVGFDFCGITSAEPFTELLDFLQQRQQKNWQSEFEKFELQTRINPKLVLPEARSIIALAKIYPECRQSAEFQGKGKIARFAWGPDYHQDLQKSLGQMVDFLRKEFHVKKAVSYVDKGPLLDRAIAARAGLGWYGKNCAIMTKRAGSWIALGEILVDIFLPEDEPLPPGCGSCTKCLDACPTGALTKPYQVNCQKCISYLTQSKKIIPDQYRALMGNSLYGCDACQDVCPYNQKVSRDLNAAAQEAIFSELDLSYLLSLSKGGFQKEYKDRAFGWLGKNILQRNALIALGNSKDPAAIPLLIKGLNSSSPQQRGYSAWALGQIATNQAYDALKIALNKENNQWVKSEIKNALEQKAPPGAGLL